MLINEQIINKHIDHVKLKMFVYLNIHPKQSFSSFSKCPFRDFSLLLLFSTFKYFETTHVIFLETAEKLM